MGEAKESCSVSFFFFFLSGGEGGSGLTFGVLRRCKLGKQGRIGRSGR